MAEYGTFTTYQEPARNDSVAVGTTSVTVSVARQAGLPRRNITIRNTSTAAADIVTLNIGTTPSVAGYGIVLRQYDTWTDSTESGYECWQGTITAICATANGVLAITER